MKAVVVTAPDEVEVRDVPEPDPGHRALVALEEGGICGTDLKIASGRIPVEYPRIMGHEMVGRVVRPGAAGIVAHGIRVLVDPSIACGHCRLCRDDRAHLCPRGALMGRDVEGVFAELVAVDELRLLPVPDEMPREEASLLQVAGTCVHAQEQVAVFPGQSAAVVGLGVSGLIHLQLLLARGVRRVVGVTRSEWKRELAAEMGAAAVASPDEAESVVAEVTEGEGADLVVEAVGKVETLAASIRLAALGGTVLVFGTITAESADRLPFYQLYYKELTIVNPRAARARDYARAISLASEGALRLAPLWSEAHPLEAAPRAFQALRADSGTLKVTLGGAGRGR